MIYYAILAACFFFGVIGRIAVSYSPKAPLFTVTCIILAVVIRLLAVLLPVMGGELQVLALVAILFVALAAGAVITEVILFFRKRVAA